MFSNNNRENNLFHTIHVIILNSNNHRQTIDMKSTIYVFLLSLIFLLSPNLSSLGSEVLITNSIRLPNDSIKVNKLITSLESFLDQKDEANTNNSFVNKDYLLETSLLLDELKGIDKSTNFNDDNFYKCYLSSVSKTTENQYTVQFSYIGVNGTIPVLRGVFTVIATSIGDEFLFHSPLSLNTSSWTRKNIGKSIVYYKPEFDISIADSYLNYASKFDNIIGINDKPTVLYCANNFNEVMKLIGVDYKLDFSGINFNSSSGVERDTTIIVNGVLASNAIQFDPHDLWHSRLRAVLAPKDTYKPVDEGCAFLFGGSWGYSWEDIKNRFHSFVKTQKDRNWLNSYVEHLDIGDEKGKALRVDYIINALIIKELYKDGDFSKVKQLLSIGRDQPNLDVYFDTLDKVIGINENNFNVEIDRLIVKYVE